MKDWQPDPFSGGFGCFYMHEVLKYVLNENHAENKNTEFKNLDFFYLL